MRFQDIACGLICLTSGIAAAGDLPEATPPPPPAATQATQATATPATTQPSPDASATNPPPAPASFIEPFTLRWWKQRTAAVGQGTLHDDVYTVTIPRSDLFLQNKMGMEIPIAAGVESRVDFYRCSCGRPLVVGAIAAADYESDQVIDALRGGGLSIVSMAPMFLDTDPQVLTIRFQGEGDVEVMAQAIKAALDSTGPDRLTTRKSK
jgi:hypothetical protein